MSADLDRQIFATSPELRRRLAEAFASFLVGELVAPGGDLWFVSAWISNIDCLDNRAGDFDALLGPSPRRWIRFAEVLASLVRSGRRARIVLRDVSHNDAIVRQITALLGPPSPQAGWTLKRSPDLHIKGFLGSSLFISGSMNLTYNGITLNDEYVLLTRDPAKLAQARLQFQHSYD
jgi:hypothetical protein